RLSYEWDLTNSLFMRVAANANYSDDYHSGLEFVNPTDERFNVDSYTLANARAVIGSLQDNWEVAAWVRNLTDEYYYHSSTFSNDAITRGVARGRTYGATFTYRLM
ncbi:MAG: hypothetical protein ACE1Y4_11010, partial [Lysobacterales bacterium]